MICPKCGKPLPGDMNMSIRFCPLCGERLFDAGKKYLIEIQCVGQREGDNAVMMVFIDDRQMYEAKAGDSIYIAVEAGFHSIKFRQKIRSRIITLLVNCNYVLKPYFNSLSGLIETNVNKVEGSSGGMTPKSLGDKKITNPVMVTEEGEKAFDILLGDDDPEYEFRATSGLKEGILRVYSERCEFSTEGQFKKEVVQYKNVVSVKRKMGSLDIECAGNVHKVYSIPKDIYNEVMAFLTNRISEVQGTP
ncbi:hypothetical protein [Butyrivibrio sp. XPD2006]|uniref:hypothetical protein n=1 Tax=Butyrivibrio sp. XPD2006 TaxID=1280668 RepID=UPI0003B67599|nr:hypothetical protein [Butyrivibrio sp. XPD2006]